MESDCINFWRQEGRLHMWRYKHAVRKCNPGLHLSADQAGMDSLLRLLNCLGVHTAGVRTVVLQKPSGVVLSKPGFPGKTICFEKIRLVYRKELEGIAFSIEEQKAGLQVGRAGVFELAQALERYREGEYDFSLPCAVSGGGTYDHSIWFW